MNSVGQSGVYLNYSATIDGTYSVYGGSSTPTAVIPVNSGVYSVLNEPSLPSVITDGTLDYVYASVGNNGGLNTTLYTAPAGVGIPTTFWSTALQNASTADWDYGNGSDIHPIDSKVVRDRCGIYNMWYTAYKSDGNFPGTSVYQEIGYAVSNSPYGSWWKYTGPFIPATSSLYGGISAIGDTAFMSIGGRLVFLFNFDNGTNLSSVVAATMPDSGACP
jgi:hypothetical protein